MALPTSYKRNILTTIGGVVAVSIIGIVVRPDSAALIIGFGTLISTQLFTQLKNVEATAEVKTALIESDAKTDSTLGKIHTLVNSSMGVQLRLNADNARFKADTTHDPIDIEAADLAAHMLKEHEGKQAVVDGKEANEK